MNEPYDSTWDDDNERLIAQKHQDWEKRDWKSWLEKNLSFPFEARRYEDADFYEGVVRNEDELFGCGHVMTILEFVREDDNYGFIVKVREKGQTGYALLGEIEVTSRDDVNFWPAREYVAWRSPTFLGFKHHFLKK